MLYPDYYALYAHPVDSPIHLQAYLNMLKLFDFTTQPDLLKALFDGSQNARRNPAVPLHEANTAFEIFRAAYYTAPRLDKRHAWLVPLLFKKKVADANIDWLIARKGWSLKRLWESACTAGLTDVILTFDPDWHAGRIALADCRIRNRPINELREIVEDYGLKKLKTRLEEARDALS